MPDNHLPDLPIYDVAWETPGTFYHTWGYKSWVKGSPLAVQVKKQIRNLSKITCMGGNYLLNVGPKSDGTVLDYEQNVLAGIGNWMKVHNEAIFDTEVNPFQKLPWGYASLKSKENNRVIYNANTSHPMFSILQKIVRQHLGLEEIVETVIERIGDVDHIALTGDYAKGIDSGNIEIIINGSNVNIDYLDNIKPKIKKKISREVSFLLSQRLDSNSIILYKKTIR